MWFISLVFRWSFCIWSLVYCFRTSSSLLSTDLLLTLSALAATVICDTGSLSLWASSINTASQFTLLNFFYKNNRNKTRYITIPSYFWVARDVTAAMLLSITKTFLISFYCSHNQHGRCVFVFRITRDWFGVVRNNIYMLWLKFILVKIFLNQFHFLLF